jgi:N-methylhydantoinase A
MPAIGGFAGKLTHDGKPERRTRSVYFSEGGGLLPTAVFARNRLPIGFSADGPSVIEEYGSTTVIGPRDRFEIGSFGEIRIHIDQRAGNEAE